MTISKFLGIITLLEKTINLEVKRLIKLDYSLEAPEERNDLVQKILDDCGEETPNNGYLEVLADYLILCM